MSKLNEAEKEAREHFTAWFLYLRETFYVRDGKPDIRSPSSTPA
jgi:hypothetical protein